MVGEHHGHRGNGVFGVEFCPSQDDDQKPYGVGGYGRYPYAAGERPYNRQCKGRERHVEPGGESAEGESRAAPTQLLPPVLDHGFEYLCGRLRSSHRPGMLQEIRDLGYFACCLTWCHSGTARLSPTCSPEVPSQVCSS